MTETLTIDRIIASTPEADGVTARVERIIHRVAEDRLERVLSSFPVVGQGEWCVPAVSVAAILDFERPDAALEEAIARAVLDAIADAVHSSETVHYPSIVDALADLVVGASTRRFTDGWMWAQLGFVEADQFERQPAFCVLTALESRPEHAVGAVVRAVRAAGLASVHRLLGDAGWVRLARIVIGVTAGSIAQVALHAMIVDTELDGDQCSPARGANTADTEDAAGRRQPDGAAVAHRPQPGGGTELITASRVVGLSCLTAAVRESRLRLEGATLRALAVLAVAESEPAVLSHRMAESVCRAASRILSGAASPVAEIGGAGTKVRPLGRQTEAVATPGKTDAPTLERAAGISTDADCEPVGDDTQWAGLLFLLSVAEDAAMPDALLSDPALDGIAAPELLARVAMTLAPVAEDDPIVLAFAGVDARRTRRTWGLALPAPMADRIHVHAVVWAQAAAQRLARPDDDLMSVVAEIVCRTARIEREQAWMDVHLDPESVDIDIRRAGLDIDPGWVPWLGSVVRFRYV